MTLCPPPAAMPDDKLPYEAYGYELLHQVWAASPRPDVVIVPDDVIAKGVTQAALALSIKVPEELTVIAMTNRGCRFFFPVPIVALEVDVKAMVAEGAGMLVDLMQNLPVPTGPRLVPPHPPADEPPAEAAPSKTPKRKTPSRPPTRKPARH
ncbi:MAG: substrate-binding domain-containing protein [Planctomycetota bacterium]|nr:substrate-binding domain-containing protein [Planctomycetota bacterium]